MKHLIAKEHWPHIKRRAILETFGFVLLLVIVVRERELLEQSLETIRNSDLLFLILALIIYWLLLPLTAISYRMLCYKKIPIFSTTLAHLAGSGPGRIIPGGLGNISMATIHLKKLGVQVHKAVVIALANNFIGITMNIIIFLFVIFNQDDIRHEITSALSADGIMMLSLLVLSVIILALWLMHFRKIRKSVIKVENQFKATFIFLIKRPKRLVGLLLISFIIILGHMLMLQLSGDAIQVDISSSNAIIALSIGILIGGLLPTPGGIGGVEAGIAATLTVLGYSTQDAVSVALLYRFITYWQPLIPGTIAYFYLRERDLI